MMRSWTICWVATGIALAISASAYANTVGSVQVKLYGAPGWGAGAPGGYAPMAGYPSENVCTGVYRLQVNTADGSYSGGGGQTIVDFANEPGNNAHTIDTFCADIWQDAPTGGYQIYNIMNLNDDSGIFGPNVGALTQAQRDKKVGDLYKLFTNHLPDGQSGWTDNSAAAFQACVWEIINESPVNGYDISTGTFWDGGSWATTANSWLTGLSSLPTVNQQGLDLFVLSNPNAQDYAAVGFGVGTQEPIPEPLTILGVLAAVGAVGSRIRKRLAA